MNWLAHLVLSEPSPAFRIGNLLPDILRGRDIAALPEKFQAGIQRHRAIDRFTDSHPVFARSRQRLVAPYRRFGGILVDIFYDHFLARSWNRYSDVSLDRFTREVYTSFSQHRHELPSLAYTRLMQIQSGDWLGAYQDLGGVRRALDGIGLRLRRPQPLGEATAQLERSYAEFDEDFTQFFPQILAHVSSRPSSLHG